MLLGKLYENCIIFFDERKKLVKGTSIFYPVQSVFIAFLVIMMIMIIPVLGMVYYQIRRNVQYLGFTDVVVITLVYGILWGYLVLEVKGRQLVIKNNYFIQRSYIIKEEIILISGIKSCRVTSGRKKGEALINFQIKTAAKTINVNMVMYSRTDIVKIAGILGFPRSIETDKKAIRRAENIQPDAAKTEFENNLHANDFNKNVGSGTADLKIRLKDD